MDALLARSGRRKSSSGRDGGNMHRAIRPDQAPVPPLLLMIARTDDMHTAEATEVIATLDLPKYQELMEIKWDYVEYLAWYGWDMHMDGRMRRTPKALA
jgi:hypothetical protein